MREAVIAKNYLNEKEHRAMGQLLSGDGSVTHRQEVEKAAGEYKKYKERTLSDVEQDYLNSIKMLGKKADKDKKRVAHEAIIN